MKRWVVFFLCLMPVGTAWSDCPADFETLGYLLEVREMMLQSNVSPWEVEEFVGDVIDELREPLPGGGYRWMELVRPEDEGPVDQTRHFVQSVKDSDDNESFDSAASNSFAMSLVVPRKRNAFRGNHRVWVGSLRLRTWIAGEMTETEEVLDRWLSPSSSERFDLEVIVDRAEARVDVSTDQGFEDGALIEVHFEQAVSRDRPDSPSFSTIRTLDALRTRLDPESIDREIRRIEESIAPGVEAIPLTQLVLWIREYDDLRKSDEEKDLDRAEEILKRILRAIPR